MAFHKRFSNLAKARSGFTLAGLAIWALLAFELGRRTQFLADLGLLLALVGAVAGVILIFMDRSQSPTAEEDSALSVDGETKEDSIAQRLLEPRHWGRTLVAAALILLVITLVQRKPVIVKSTPQATPAAPVTVEIPPITLQGVTVAQGKPIALIDQGTYQIGDVIHGLRIVAITERSVTITYAGTTNVLQLGVNRFQLATTGDRLP